MDDDEDQRVLFGIPDFSLSIFSQLTKGLQEGDSPLFTESGIIDIETERPEYGVETLQEPIEDDYFAIPDLSFSSSDQSPTPESSVESIEDGGAVDFIRADEIWDLLPTEPNPAPSCLTWERFYDNGDEEPQTSYITEAGPSVFDAALEDEVDAFGLKNRDHLVVDTSIYVSSLLAMGLGRSSVLFNFDETKGSFVQAVPNLRVTGYTADTLSGIKATFVNCGNLVRGLQGFVDNVYRQVTSPCRIALADAVSILLRNVQTRLSLSNERPLTILQLQDFFSPAEHLLVTFDNLIQGASDTENDEKLLSMLYEQVGVLEHRSDSMNDILSETLSHVSRPLLDFAGEWLGIEREQNNAKMEKTGNGRSFVKIEDRIWLDEQGIEMSEPDFALSEDMVPTFLLEKDAIVLFETGRSLRFLQTHHPEHPLAKPDVIASASPPVLSWAFSWQKVGEIEAKAFQYEKSLTAAIKSCSVSGPSEQLSSPINTSYDYSSNYFGLPEEDIGACFLAAMSNVEQPLPELSRTEHLSTLINENLVNRDHKSLAIDLESALPLSLSSYLSFGPIIAAQARVVNGATMRLFFHSHDLREHLSIQRRFQLLGDGVFSSRLAHALFDPELETAERQAGVARTGGIMGLRLGGRDTWPPATSELRLALMGVVTDSYYAGMRPTDQKSGVYLDPKAALPGDLSFAVRDMSDEEIARCVDPNSVEALDFLRLSYRPPAPLDAVITPMALYKYDQLYKLLLRILRMLYAVGQLFRDATDRTSYWQGIDDFAQRFRIESHHFITCVAAYFFDVGIAATWTIFERKLDETEVRLKAKDGVVVLEYHEGIDALRDYHEKVLDRIMFSLLLRKRQGPVMKVLEEIFAMVLVFAKYSRTRATGLKRKFGQDEEVEEMYRKFHKKVAVFIDVCRGMTDRKGFGERGEGDRKERRGGLFDTTELVEENTIVQLLSRLEMSGYY